MSGTRIDLKRAHHGSNADSYTSGDAEPVVEYNREISGGPQNGLSVPSMWVHIGDNSSAGGSTVPASNDIVTHADAGLYNAISANREIDNEIKPLISQNEFGIGSQADIALNFATVAGKDAQRLRYDTDLLMSEYASLLDTVNDLLRRIRILEGRNDTDTTNTTPNTDVSGGISQALSEYVFWNRGVSDSSNLNVFGVVQGATFKKFFCAIHSAAYSAERVDYYSYFIHGRSYDPGYIPIVGEIVLDFATYADTTQYYYSAFGVKAMNDNIASVKLLGPVAPADTAATEADLGTFLTANSLNPDNYIVTHKAAVVVPHNWLSYVMDPTPTVTFLPTVTSLLSSGDVSTPSINYKYGRKDDKFKHVGQFGPFSGVWSPDTAQHKTIRFPFKVNYSSTTNLQATITVDYVARQIAFLSDVATIKNVTQTVNSSESLPVVIGNNSNMEDFVNSQQTGLKVTAFDASGITIDFAYKWHVDSVKVNVDVKRLS